MLKSGFRICAQLIDMGVRCHVGTIKVVRNIASASATAEKLKPVEVKKRIGKKKKIDVTTKQGFYRVAAFSTGEEYNLEDIIQNLKAREMLEPSTLSRDLQNEDMVHAMIKPEEGSEPQDVFVFREGAVVAWNLSDIDMEALLSLIKKNQIRGYSEDIIREESEVMNYAYGKAGVKTTLLEDDIIVEQQEDTRLDKYAVSNAIALSVKLGTWEALLSRYIDSIEDVTNDLRSGTKIRMSQADVMRRTGELFVLRHNINLSSDLLDTPDVYWDREELEKIYQVTYSYFAIGKRTRVINEKINHCVELVELLSSHLRDNHHVRLEWMIIVLIMAEVMFEVLRHFEPKPTAAAEAHTVSPTTAAAGGHTISSTKAAAEEHTTSRGVSRAESKPPPQESKHAPSFFTPGMKEMKW